MLILNRSDASTHSGTISGTGAVTKQGTGTLTLSGNNSYTGGTTIGNGVLALGSANAVGTSGTITFGGGTLQYSVSNTTDYSSRFSTAASQAYKIDTKGQNVTLASPLTSSGGTLTKSGTGTLTLSGSSSYTGGTTISAGTLQVGVGGTTGSITGDLVNNASVVFNRSDAFTYSVGVSGTGAVTKQGSGTLTLSGNNSYTGDTRTAAGTLALGSVNGVAGSTLDMNALDSGTVAFTAASTQTYNVGGLKGSRDLAIGGNTLSVGGNGQSTTYAGSLSGTGALAKQGAGTLTLSGNNSYTGGTNLSAGVLAVGGASALGTGTLALNGGALSAAAGGVSFANAVSLNANTTIAGSDALTISGNVTLNGFNTLTFTNTAQATISGQIGQSTTSILIKQGSGELQLTGANTYTGGTLVQSGTVRINNSTGSAFGSGAVTVESGATLTGAGSISGAVQMNGTWAPGNSPGLVTVNSNVVLGGSLDMELGGVLRAASGTGGTGYYDAINVYNALALGGTLNVSPYNGFVPSYGDSFLLLQAAALTGDFGTVNYPALSGGLSWERTTSATAMTITVVPEPSSYAISAIATAGLASLMRWRKRRNRESTA
jgi:autotransporter-associated beta strand protein